MKIALRRSVLCVAAVGVVCVASCPALAQTEPTVGQIKAAEEDFTRGREAYKKGDYSEAAEAFESADGHAPNEKVIELAIRAREKAGMLDRAATLAQLALERHPDSARIQELAEPIIEQARGEMLIVTIQCDEPCGLLDGTRIVHGQATERRIVYLKPGEHTIRAGWTSDRADSQKVDGSAGEQASLNFVAPEIPPEPIAEPQPVSNDPMADSPASEPASGMTPLVFWVGAGLTAAVGGVTIWSGVDTLNNPGKEAVRDACAGQSKSCPEYQEGQSKELRTNILLGATGALGVGTIIIGAFFTDWSGGDSAQRKASHTAHISPWIDVGRGATLGATGRF